MLGLSPPYRFRAGCGHPGSPGPPIRITRQSTALPDSDLDLLITVPVHWLAGRVRVLGALWREYSSHRLPLDLLLYCESEVSQRQQYRTAVTSQAYQEGILLHG
jgi:hypothetical protein